MTRNRNTLLALSLCLALVPGAASAVDNNDGGAVRGSATVGSLAPNQGHFICTAAINATGTIASRLAGSYVSSAVLSSGGTGRISIGTYQVGFVAPCNNVQIAKGWMRVVQSDTLGTGSQPPGYCTVADRSTFVNALFIQCFNPTGILTDTSFTVSVSR